MKAKKSTDKFKGRNKGIKDSKPKASFNLDLRENYTPEQLAAWWHLPGKTTVLRAIRLGNLIASKIGRGYVILGADAMKYQKKNRVYTQHIKQ